jgi:hypothetical protein
MCAGFETAVHLMDISDLLQILDLPEIAVSDVLITKISDQLPLK